MFYLIMLYIVTAGIGLFLDLIVILWYYITGDEVKMWGLKFHQFKFGKLCEPVFPMSNLFGTVCSTICLYALDVLVFFALLLLTAILGNWVIALLAFGVAVQVAHLVVKAHKENSHA